MTKTRKQLKKIAIGNMAGHYGVLIGSLLFSVVIPLLFNIPFSSMISQGIAFGVPFRIAVGVLGMIIVLLFVILFHVGIQWIHLRLARGWEAKFLDLFNPFTAQPGKFVGIGLLEILVGIVCLLPGVLCLLFSVIISYTDSFSFEVTNQPLFIIAHFALLAGGIILVRILFAWCMAIYLFLEYPDLRLFEGIRESRVMMKRNKWKRLVLMLSFLGWLALSVLSFFIALIWLIPYYTQSITCFYTELRPDAPPDPNPRPASEENRFDFKDRFNQ